MLGMPRAEKEGAGAVGKRRERAEAQDGGLGGRGGFHWQSSPGEMKTFLNCH